MFCLSITLCALLPQSARAEEPVVFKRPPPPRVQIQDEEDPAPKALEASRAPELGPLRQPLRVRSSRPATLRVDGVLVGETPQTIELPFARHRYVWKYRPEHIVGGIAGLAASGLLGFATVYLFQHPPLSGLDDLLRIGPQEEPPSKGVNVLGLIFAVLTGVAVVGSLVAIGSARYRASQPTPTRFRLGLRLSGESRWHEVELRGTAAAAAFPTISFDAKRQRWQTACKPCAWRLLQMR